MCGCASQSATARGRRCGGRSTASAPAARADRGEVGVGEADERRRRGPSGRSGAPRRRRRRRRRHDEQRQLSRAAVSSSAQRHERPPSPSAATVSRSGSAIAAPIAPPRPSPTAWKPFGKTQRARVGDVEEHRRLAEEVAGVDATVLRSDGSRSSSAIEKCAGRSTRPVDARRRARRASGGRRSALASSSASGSRSRVAAGVQLGAQRLGGRARRPRRSRGRAGRFARCARGSTSTWTTARVGADQRAVLRRPVVERRAERRARRRPAGSSSAANGEANPPEIPSAYGSRAKRPLRRRARSPAPRRSCSPSALELGAGVGEHGTAAGDDRRPLRAGEQVCGGGDRLRRRLGRRRAREWRLRRLGLGGRLRLHVDRQHQHDRTALDDARAGRRGRRRRRRSARCGPGRRSPRPTRPGRAGRSGSSRSAPPPACRPASTSTGVRVLAASASPVIVFVSPGP